MIVNEDVTRCYHSCPFFEAGMDYMACGHPYFDDKDLHDSLIITHDNSHDRVPDECPLKNHPVNTTVSLG
jgi:hypothetical protein